MNDKLKPQTFRFFIKSKLQIRTEIFQSAFFLIDDSGKLNTGF